MARGGVTGITTAMCTATFWMVNTPQAKVVVVVSAMYHNDHHGVDHDDHKYYHDVTTVVVTPECKGPTP